VGRNAAEGVVEFWDRRTGERRDVALHEVLAAIRAGD